MINLFAALICAWGALIAATNGLYFLGVVDLILMGANLYFYVKKLEATDEERKRD